MQGFRGRTLNKVDDDGAFVRKDRALGKDRDKAHCGSRSKAPTQLRDRVKGPAQTPFMKSGPLFLNLRGSKAGHKIRDPRLWRVAFYDQLMRFGPILEQG